jgi:hypothetical protein
MKNNDTNASDPSNIANGSKTQSGKLPLLIAAIIKTNRTVVRLASSMNLSPRVRLKTFQTAKPYTKTMSANPPTMVKTLPVGITL